MRLSEIQDGMAGRLPWIPVRVGSDDAVMVSRRNPAGGRGAFAALVGASAYRRNCQPQNTRQRDHWHLLTPAPPIFSGGAWGSDAPNYFGAASQRSNSAISFFWAAMIFLAMAFITGDLPWASSISAMSTAP